MNSYEGYQHHLSQKNTYEWYEWYDTMPPINERFTHDWIIWGVSNPWGYPQSSSISRWDFPHKPSSYWGTPIYGNHHINCNVENSACVVCYRRQFLNPSPGRNTSRGLKIEPLHSVSGDYMPQGRKRVWKVRWNSAKECGWENAQSKCNRCYRWFAVLSFAERGSGECYTVLMSVWWESDHHHHHHHG